MSKGIYISEGKATLGIEFGSTRIKAVLIGQGGEVLAAGDHGWENHLDDGIWTYPLEEVWSGLQDAYASLQKDVLEKYDVKITKLASIGFSAMMHGYLAFNAKDELLVPFRTWRNTITGEAAEKLTEAFDFNIPQRWSISHLYQAVLNKEPHVKDITFFTTLAGYVHWKLTGEKVLGVGDASGMFPIDSNTNNYDAKMLKTFASMMEKEGFGWNIEEILPKVLVAGENAGTLTKEGAALLDVTNTLEAGIPLCPPEGDAGTGMTATNSVGKRTGNISAGTSIFAMVVLEKALSKAYPELDLVTTPDGAAVAMVHCNNCTSDINDWVGLFREFAADFGMEIDNNTLFTAMYKKALAGDADCGGLVSYNYVSGEPVTGFEKGAPLFVRTPENSFNLGNVMRTHLYSALASLAIGLDLLFEEEHVTLDKMYGHGGYFKTPEVGQRFASAAIKAPVTVMETAGEGGAWGIAVLAAFMMEKKDGQSLQDYLNECIFAGQKETTVEAGEEDRKGFDAFMANYRAGLAIEKAAVETLMD